MKNTDYKTWILTISVQVALPDGRIQYVKYTADGNYGGTTMEVSYKGEARHPEHSSHNVIHESSGPIIHEGIVWEESEGELASVMLLCLIFKLFRK